MALAMQRRFLFFCVALASAPGTVLSFFPFQRSVRTLQRRNMSSTDTEAQLIVSLRDYLGEKNKIRLILASQSPRRREILDMMGLAGKYNVIPSTLDESALQVKLLGKAGDTAHAVDPKDYTRTLAEEKAKALAEVMSKDVTQPTLVLGSDTIVDQDGDILEKPENVVDAKRMIAHLSGNEHCVHTGVAIYRVLPQDSSVNLLTSFTDTAMVRFADLSEADMDAYVATGEPMDKAGSYGIQGIGGQLVSSIQGDFFTVSSALFVVYALGRRKRVRSLVPDGT